MYSSSTREEAPITDQLRDSPVDPEKYKVVQFFSYVGI
jgi:hypothetical protein